jgi:hypothetical protein
MPTQQCNAHKQGRPAPPHQQSTTPQQAEVRQGNNNNNNKNNIAITINITNKFEIVVVLRTRILSSF